MGIHSSSNKQTGKPAQVIKPKVKQGVGQSAYSLTLGAALEAGTTVATSLTNITDAVGLTDLNLEGDIAGALPTKWMREAHAGGEGKSEVVGDIALLFGGAGPATRGVRALGTAARASKSKLINSTAGRILPDMERAAKEANALRAYDESLGAGLAAKTGQVVGRVNDTHRKTLRNQFLKTSTINGAKEAVAMEAAMVASMNSSDLFFPEDASMTNFLLFAGGGTALGAGIERAFASSAARFSYKSSLQAGAKAKQQWYAENKNAVRDGQVSTLPGQAWTMANDAAVRIDALDAHVSDTTAMGSGPAAQAQIAALNSAKTASMNTFTRATDTLSGQTFALKGKKGSTKFTLPKTKEDRQQRELFLSWSREDPSNTFGIFSLETKQSAKEFRGAKDKEKAGLLAREQELMNGAHKLTPDQVTAELSATSKRLQELDDIDARVLEPTGVENLHPQSRKEPWHERAGSKQEISKVKYRRDRGHVSGPAKIKLDNEGGVYVRDKPVMAERQTFEEITATYAMLGKVKTQNGGFGPDLANQMVPTRASNYAVLDFLVDSGTETIRDVDLAGLSLQKKYEAYARHGSRKEPEDIYTLSKRLNLQLHDDRGGLGYVGQAFEAMRQLEVSEATMLGNTVDDMVENMAEMVGKDMNARTKAAIADGIRRELDYGMLDLQVGAQPLGMLRDIKPAMTDVRATAVERAEIGRNVTLGLLEDSEYMSDAVRAISADEKLLESARAVDELGIRDSGDNRFNPTAVAEGFVQTTRLLDRRPIAAIKEVGDRVRQIRERQITGEFEEYGRLLREMAKPENAGAQAQFSAYKDALSMVDIKPKFAHSGLIELDVRSERTRRFFRENFNEKLGKNDVRYLFDPSAAKQGVYKPLEIQENTADLLAQTTMQAHRALDELNEMRLIRGEAPKTKRNGYVMPADFSKKEVQFLRNRRGEVIGYVAADNPAELRRSVDQALKDNPALSEIDRQEIELYRNMREEMFDTRMTNFSDSQLQTGAAKGRVITSRPDISGQALQDQFVALREFRRHNTTRMLETYFEPELIRAREIGEATGQSGNQTANRSFTAAQEYKRLLRGSGELPREAFMSQVNNTASVFWAQGYDVMAEKLRGAKSVLPVGRRTRKALEAAVEGYRPMSNAVDSVIEQYKTTNTNQLRELSRVTAALNKAFGFLTLNFAEVGHPLLTVASLAVTTPAVRNALVRQKGESMERFLGRNGPIADYIDDVNVVPSSFKIMTDASEMMISAEGKKIRKAAAERGFLDAHYIEGLNNDVFTRPGSIQDIARKTTKLADILNAPINAVRGATGRSTDFNLSAGTENFAREWAFSAGYSVAKRMPQAANDAERFTIAHHIANQIIADYNPSIRPEFHRGAVGTSLGLFQTFATGYMQRMFSIIENKQQRVALSQAFAQTAVFGAEGIPGFEAVADWYMDTGNGGVDFEGGATLVDRVYNKMGKGTADWLFTGSLANFPKVLGADDGLGIYTRGDTNPRVVANPLMIQEAPAVKMLHDTGAGMVKLIKSAATDGGLSGQELGEVMATFPPSRTMRSMAELVMGQSYNRNGDIVNSDTRTTMGIVSRIIGSKEASEMQIRKGMWKNSKDEKKRKQRMANLGSSLTSAIRESDGKLTAKQLEYYRDRYAAVAGSEEGFNRALLTYTKKAMVEKPYRTGVQEAKNEGTAYRNERTLDFFRPNRVTEQKAALEQAKADVKASKE